MTFNEFIDAMEEELDDFIAEAEKSPEVLASDLTPAEWLDQMMIMLDAKYGKASN